VLGRSENSYPKIRAPDLQCGPLCKHLVRTLTTLQSDMLVRRRIADAIQQSRDHLDKPGRSTKLRVIRVTQAEADKLTSGSARRIAVKPAQRGASMPVAASQADLTAALAAFSGLADANSKAITRGLRALLKTQGTAA
jgi:hypothetical protein